MPHPPPPGNQVEKVRQVTGRLSALCAASVLWPNGVVGGVASHFWLPRVCVVSLFRPSLSPGQLFFTCLFCFSSFLATHLLKFMYSMCWILGTCGVSQAGSEGLGTQR